MKKVLILFFACITNACSQGATGEGEMQLVKATFAGGCFWCMERPFDAIEGVHGVMPGYTGGITANPTYEDVCTGETGHLEAVQITYDPTKVTYEKLLEIFWRQINPMDGGGQFVDRGSQYKTAIFYHNDAQKRIAEQSKSELERSGKIDRPIATEIRPAGTFYPAEDYHRKFYLKNPLRYRIYRQGSGRERTLEDIWGK